MDKKLAAVILGLSELDSKDPDFVEEQYEEEVFKITSFFLNRAFIPKLAQAKIERLKKLEEAYASLTDQEFEEFRFAEIDYSFQEVYTIHELVLNQQSVEMKLKLALSNAQNARSAVEALNAWSQMVVQYAGQFIAIFPTQEKETPKVATTQIVDYGELLSEIKNGKLDGLALAECARLSHLI